MSKKTDAQGELELRAAMPNPSTPEIYADHVMGIEDFHGVGRVLMAKHRPVPAMQSDRELVLADMPQEACLLMMPISGLRELKEKLDVYFSKEGEG